LPNLREVYFNYNEIERKSTQKEIFDICLELNLKIFEIKGNEINTKLWKEYRSRVRSKIDKVSVYSDEEDSKEKNKIDYEDESEEEVDNLGRELEKKLDIKK
jgi:Ran GTPase-activating protein (RanGAP) involved in mRNA processing and transport